MKCKKIFQFVIFITGTAMIGYGVIRGEAAVVFGKAIKLCLECVGIGEKNEITIKKSCQNTGMDTGNCHITYQYPYSQFT